MNRVAHTCILRISFTSHHLTGLWRSKFHLLCAPPFALGR